MNYNKSLFEGVPKKKANQTRFNLSHEWKAQGLLGYLTPCLVMETLPQDEFTIDTEFMFRFNPLYFPMMQKVTMRADYFFVPNRIVWPKVNAEEVTGWENWIMGKDALLEHPYFDARMPWSDVGFNNNVLGYMGIPYVKDLGGVGADEQTTTIAGLNAFPISGYFMIYDEYYRDPQLQDKVWRPLVNGDNSVNIYDYWNNGGFPVDGAALPTNWEKDYFTSCLPTPQVGEAIKIPSIGVDEDGQFLEQSIKKLDGTNPLNTVPLVSTDGTPTISGSPVVIETSAVIQQIRLAEVLQSYYERMMKVGQRYRDFIKGFWGNDPQPMAVDVPVLIKSTFGRVQIADVMTTAVTGTPDSATGDYRGQMNLYENGGGKIKYNCNEHGFIFCILQLNPNTSYGQGIERFWRRSVPTDYPLDMFASIGDQEVLKEEVLWNSYLDTIPLNQGTFGYIPRFSEMRYKNNMHIGNLVQEDQNGLSQTLGRWWDEALVHSTGSYDASIEINWQFNKCYDLDASDGGLRTTDVFRVLPSLGGNQFPAEGTVYMHVFHSIYVNRSLPLYSTPDLT